MLIPLEYQVRRYGVGPGPTLHVGAHLGEEAIQYVTWGFEPVWWVEPNEDLIRQLQNNVLPYGDHVICALLSDEEKEVDFHIASNGQSSSYFELGTHATEHPEVSYIETRRLKTTTIDMLFAERLIEQATYLCIDVEGAELDVLAGAEAYITGVNAVYTEVSQGEVRIGCAQEPEVTAWLNEHGFTGPIVMEMTKHGWGDCLFRRMDA